jgi:hypothetical protein
MGFQDPQSSGEFSRSSISPTTVRPAEPNAGVCRLRFVRARFGRHDATGRQFRDDQGAKIGADQSAIFGSVATIQFEAAAISSLATGIDAVFPCAAPAVVAMA